MVIEEAIEGATGIRRGTEVGGKDRGRDRGRESRGVEKELEDQ